MRCSTGDPNLCSRGCQRAAFSGFGTCCTHCRGGRGPHARNCARRAVQSSLSSLGCTGGALVIRIIRARLFRSFHVVGLMDPFAVAEYLPEGSEAKKTEIGRTRSAWQAHMHPVWNHMCRAAHFVGPDRGDLFTVRVLEENMGGLANPTFCGEVSVAVEELLADASDVSQGVKTSQPKDLDLLKRGEHTGFVSVQAVLHLTDFCRHIKTLGSFSDCGDVGQQLQLQRLTPVDPSLFEAPVERMGVSGGTASFFALRLRSPKAGQGTLHWIGKDLSHATDEIGFYEQRLELAQVGSHGMEPLFGFMFDYAGMLECSEMGTPKDAPKRQLLVLRNLRDGCRSFRMLDIKVGEKTAAAGWLGKSWFAAMKQKMLDGMTNSYAEGFRLEGFEGQPPTLQSMDPLLDFGGRESAPAAFGKMGKKVQRLLLQRMQAAEMFAHFMDVHQDPPGAESVSETVTPTELAAIVMGEIVDRLVRLSLACRTAPAPQKWIGSSVALGFDVGRLPARGVCEQEILKSVHVNIFDWGRSELNTLEHHTALSARDQADRLEFWRFYSAGIDRLSWEAARYCWHHYGNTVGWSHAQITVYDFDSHSSNDYIGQVQLKLAPCTETTQKLLDTQGVPVAGKAGQASITYSVSWRKLPPGCRFVGAWRVTVLRAQHLPSSEGIKIGINRSGTSDPFVTVSAQSTDGLFQSQHYSCVLARNLDPVWNETFELPVAVRPPILSECLKAHSWKATKLFPPAASPGAVNEDDYAALARWSRLLAQVSGRRSFRWLT